MQLVRLTDACPDGRDCPAIFQTDRGTIVVQGGRLSPAEIAAMNLPEGETAAELPAELLEVAARALGYAAG